MAFIIKTKYKNNKDGNWRSIDTENRLKSKQNTPCFNAGRPITFVRWPHRAIICVSRARFQSKRLLYWFKNDPRRPICCSSCFKEYQEMLKRSKLFYGGLKILPDAKSRSCSPEATRWPARAPTRRPELWYLSHPIGEHSEGHSGLKTNKLNF